MGQDGFFDVDLFWDDLTQYFEKDQKKEPLIMIRRGHFFSEDYNKDIANKLKERAYVIDPINPPIITDAFLKAKMVENNNLLQRVLERIKSHQRKGERLLKNKIYI